MGDAVGQILPLAIGAALSPIPIIAVVLIVGTPRARVNGPAFIVGWLAGLAAIGLIVLAIADPAGAAGVDNQPAGWVNVLKLLLGLLLLLVAVRDWKHRPHEGESVTPPKWMAAVDRFSPLKAAAAGVVFASLNPKNTLLAISAATSIAAAGIAAGQQAIAYGIFALVATLGVGIPVVLYLVMGDRSRHMLDSLETWMARNNAVIMAVLCLLIGVKLIGDAIGGLSS